MDGCTKCLTSTRGLASGPFWVFQYLTNHDCGESKKLCEVKAL